MMPTERTPPETMLQGVKKAASAKARTNEPTRTKKTCLISSKRRALETVIFLTLFFIFGLHFQVSVDERIDFPIHHPSDIGRLEVGPIVFHEGVRAEDIATDLGTPFDVLLLADDRLHFGIPFLKFADHQLVGQHLHASRFVVELAPLDFALNH